MGQSQERSERYDEESQDQRRVGQRSSETKEEGFADPKTKTIWISKAIATSQEEYRLQVVIVHEICHAVTNSGHGPTFINRLKKAAERARQLKEKALAKKLDKEALDWKDVDIVRADDIYQCVRDVASEIQDYERMLDILSMDWGLTKSELLNRYSRIPKVFEERLEFLRNTDLI